SAALALTLLAPSVLLPPPSAATPTVAYVQLAPDPRLAEHLPFGLPGTGELHVRDGYALSYDSWLKVPRWVGYRVSHEGLAGDAVRGDDFRPDPELKPHQSAQLEDYRRSGQQRGHMAPAGSMRHDPKRMSESFLLSNIAPQVRGVNVGLWRSLEARERAWAEARGDVFVMTGPAFLPVDGDKEIRFAVIGNSRVAVPTHFWKIIARRAPDGSLETLAFLVPNHEGLAKDLGRYLVSVRELERVTGLDFFSALPDEQARPLKAEAAGRLWP
ncbi:MAG TPA: DNA/RNA non-specific endonuclease, partial [Elusimicrobiota bacterium]|nr:DNA/RNA non-specific endonuclease [Elusimicrobiota bacterium]